MQIQPSRLIRSSVRTSSAVITVGSRRTASITLSSWVSTNVLSETGNTVKNIRIVRYVYVARDASR